MAGHRTYIISRIGILSAAAAYMIGDMDIFGTPQTIFTLAGIYFLRRGMDDTKGCKNGNPKKFQNDDGTLNHESPMKSYAELEKKIGTMVSVPNNDADDALREMKNFFGGDEKMQNALQDIATFGEKFLSKDTFEHLCATQAGIRRIYAMIQSMEPPVATNSNGADSLTDKGLRDLMRDPKYWCDRDAEYVRKIENGFKKLYA